MTARLISLFVDPARRREAVPRGLARWRLVRVLDYIEANFRRPVSLDELSQVADLSRIRFGVQFRQAMGVTPYAFILQRRVAYSQQLLREGEIPLAEIALMAGFSSQAHFTTTFSRATGISPGQWRRVAENDPAPPSNHVAPPLESLRRPMLHVHARMGSYVLGHHRTAARNCGCMEGTCRQG